MKTYEVAIEKVEEKKAIMAEQEKKPPSEVTSIE